MIYNITFLDAATGIRFYCPIAIKYLPVPPYDDPTPIEDTDTEYTVFASEGVPEC